VIDEITIQTANAADLPVVLPPAEETSVWLQSKALDQWQRPPGVERLLRHIGRSDGHQHSCPEG